MLRQPDGFMINIITKYRINQRVRYYRIRQRMRIIQAIEFCLCRCYEKRLGIDTLGVIQPPEKKKNLFRDENAYEALCYVIRRKILHYLRPGRADVIMDLGCGKGRAICFFAAERRVKRVIGVELYKGLYEAAVENINNLLIKMSKINTYHADVVNFTDIDDVTIFLLHNPFGAKTLTKLIKNIEKSLKVNPRTIRIVYYPTPNLARLFDETPRLFFKKRLIVMAKSPIYLYGNQKD